MPKDVTDPTDNSHPWPEGAIVYHVYVRSFKDSNDDGIGDIPGVTQQLDYIVSLGVQAIWFSPFYPSPMVDFGYDVANYRDIDPAYGTMADFTQLLSIAHERGLKVMIDLVPNHTSDQHPWFLASRSSLDNSYADWYVWHRPSYNSAGEALPPNNWLNAMDGGAAWEWEPARQQYYLHSFHKRQPDLNWNNPKVREAIKAVMRFWLDLGVDGFRVDAVYWLGKDPLFTDDPPNPDFIPGVNPATEMLSPVNSRGWPVMYSYLAELATVLEEPVYAGRAHFMVTEAYPDPSNPTAAYMNFYVAMDPRVAAPFNFEGIALPWQAAPWQQFLRSFHHALAVFNPRSIPAYAFGNHDRPRIVSRLGELQARAAAVLQLSLPGLVFIYYGEELGMHDVAVSAAELRDPAAGGDPASVSDRDPERSPMQWNGQTHAGFSAATSTWLSVAADYPEHNVEQEDRDPESFLTLYRRLGQLRGATPALSYGAIELKHVDDPDLLVYSRRVAGYPGCLIVINFSDQERNYPTEASLSVAVSSSPQRSPDQMITGSVRLQPYEAAIFWLAD